jgi:hypothetical protein
VTFLYMSTPSICPTDLAVPSFLPAAAGGQVTLCQRNRLICGIVLSGKIMFSSDRKLDVEENLYYKLLNFHTSNTHKSKQRSGWSKKSKWPKLLPLSSSSSSSSYKKDHCIALGGGRSQSEEGEGTVLFNAGAVSQSVSQSVERAAKNARRASIKVRSVGQRLPMVSQI